MYTHNKAKQGKKCIETLKKQGKQYIQTLEQMRETVHRKV